MILLIRADKDKNSKLIQDISEKQAELDKYVKRDIKIQSTMYTDLKTLFEYIGVPCLQAKGEADALCVRLYKEGHVVGVLSEDMDILPFGAKLIRGIKDKRSMIITEYDLEKIIKDLGFTQDQMIDLCILCGCDYACKIEGVGAKTGLNLIKKYNNIETILKEHIEPDLARGDKSKYRC